MASENVAQPNKTVLLHVAHLESVVSAVVERDEQLYAMASSLLMHLSPQDETNIPDGYPITAWRLAQLLDDMLSSTSHSKFVRTCLIGAN
jgi:hypothetical protein